MARFYALYREGWRLFLLVRKHKNNIPLFAHLLNTLKKRQEETYTDFPRLTALSQRLYYASPWMWRHRCLYESLLDFIINPSAQLNIGLDIRYHGPKTGHCWTTVNGKIIHDKDRVFAQYYKQQLYDYQNIFYWLPEQKSKKTYLAKPSLKLGESK